MSLGPQRQSDAIATIVDAAQRSRQASHDRGQLPSGDTEGNAPVQPGGPSAPQATAGRG